jgi:MFS family permease
MLAGFRYLQADALLLGIAISLTLMNFMNGPYWAVVLPVQIEAEFGNASRFGLLLTLLGVGNLVGGTLYGAIGHRFRHLRWQIYLLGISTFPAYAWLWYTGAPYAVLAVGGLLMGVISGPINPLMVTVRMERIPPHLRGRVFATFSGLAGAATPLGMVFNGWLIDTAGASRGILIISTFATVVVTILWLLPGLHAMNEDTTASVRERRLAPDPTE